MAKKILCVIRTSTVAQETESQHNDMLGFLTDKGLNYSEDEIEWIEVAGASARSVNKEYLDMLESIKATILNNETIKAAAFWHLNRLGRWEKYIVDMKDWFINNHIQVYVKTPNLKLFNEDGSLNAGDNIAWGVFASMVSYDTMEMMEKMQRGKQTLKEKGKWIGTKLHYGFMVSADREVVPNYDELKNVQMIYDEYATGNYSVQKLHIELQSRGYTFTERHIWRILQNEIYKDYVGAELWDKVKEIRNGKFWNANTKESKHCYIGLKILKCTCGSNYISNSGHYVCYRKKHFNRFPENERCTCSPMPKTDVIDTILWDIASHIHRQYLLKVDSNSIEELSKRKNILIQKQHQTNIELTKCTDKINRAKELYLEGDLSKADYEKRKGATIAESIRMQSDLEKMQDEIEQIDDNIERLKNPDLINQVAIMASVGDIDNNAEMRDIVKKHIKFTTLSFTEYNNRKCILIEVVDKEDYVRKFIYDYNKTKRNHDIFNKLYAISPKDGSIYPYSYSHKPIHEIETEKLKGSIELMKDSDAMQKYLTNMLPSLRLAMSEGLNTGLTEEDLERIERMKQEEVTDEILEQLHFTTSVIQVLNNKDKE